MKSKKNEINIRDFMKKFENDLKKQIRREEERMLSSLNHLYWSLRKKSIISKKVESILIHLKRRIGGFSHDNIITSLSEKNLIEDLLSAMNSLGGIASVREILVELHKRGWRIQERDLIEIIYNLAKNKGIFSVSQGVVIKGNITELQLTKRIIKELHQKPMTIKELAEKLGRDVHVIKVIIEFLKDTGIITVGKDKVFLIK